MMKRADDTHSETSHETTNSDSGRGGSDEDINSNRGHALSDTGKYLTASAAEICIFNSFNKTSHIYPTVFVWMSHIYPNIYLHV